MRTFIELSTLTDGSPWRRKVMFDTVPTCGDYYTPLDAADKEDWHWRSVTTPDDIESKRRFHDQYFLARNELVVVDDIVSIAAGNLLIARDLNLCRLWAVTGGRALWLNAGVLLDVSGSNDDFLRKCAEEGFHAAISR